MNVFIIGDGAREHAITIMLKKSSKVETIYCCTNNVGIRSISTNVKIDIKNKSEIREFIKNKKIDLVVVGPEKPLVDGIYDDIKDVTFVFGASKDASMLEGSKVYSKNFMNKYNIPTAKSIEVNDVIKAKEELLKFEYPHVIKVDGLASGKGVIITNNEDEDNLALDRIFIKKEFGESGNNVIIEEFLDGKEFSAFYLLDNKTYRYFSNARDFKRAFDNDEGLNTGGMGALSPIDLTEKEKKELDDIAKKTFMGIKNENLDYKGIIFLGLMRTSQGLKVLEYNVRFGDPETQAMLVRLKTDLFDVMYCTAKNNLVNLNLEFLEKKSVCVVAASEDYPINPKINRDIKIGNIKKCFAFYGGISDDNGALKTLSGRVVSIVSVGKDFDEARKQVYSSISNIEFKGMWYRKDI